MNKLVRNTVIHLLLIVSGYVIGGEVGYRIAGIIANGAANWQAIVELPGGEQRLVKAGDVFDKVVVVSISKEGVTLQFPGGEEQMRLSEGAYFAESGDPMPQPRMVDGVLVGDFSKRLETQLSPKLLSGVKGLETLNRLSNSARIVAYSYIGDTEEVRKPIGSLDSGVNLIQQAILEGKDLRITVEGDDSFPDFYIMSVQPE